MKNAPQAVQQTADSTSKAAQKTIRKDITSNNKQKNKIENPKQARNEHQQAYDKLMETLGSNREESQDLDSAYPKQARNEHQQAYDKLMETIGSTANDSPDVDSKNTTEERKELELEGIKNSKSHTLESLEKKINQLKRGDETAQKKALILKYSRDVYLRQNISNQLKLHRLINQRSFKIEPDKIPKHIKDKSCLSSFSSSFTDKFFDYKEAGSNEKAFWVDFANKKLGGGVFTHGAVQEEIMAMETPNMANLIAENPANREHWCTISTRNDELGSIIPEPLLLEGAKRVTRFNGYNTDFQNATARNILEKVETLSKPQDVNILAIAAPDHRNIVSRGMSQQEKDQRVLTKEILQDIYNTLYAGFTLVKEHTPQNVKPVINSGPFGCGAFHNNTNAVYLLHLLAANQVSKDLGNQGILLNMHAYKDNKAKPLDRFWSEEIKPKLGKSTVQDLINDIRQACKNPEKHYFI